MFGFYLTNFRHSSTKNWDTMQRTSVSSGQLLRQGLFLSWNKFGREVFCSFAIILCKASFSSPSLSKILHWEQHSLKLGNSGAFGKYCCSLLQASLETSLLSFSDMHNSPCGHRMSSLKFNSSSSSFLMTFQLIESSTASYLEYLLLKIN